MLTAGKEAWERLFALISTETNAEAALLILRADAALRTEQNWDWAKEGYGSTILSFVTVSELRNGWAMVSVIEGRHVLPP